MMAADEEKVVSLHHVPASTVSISEFKELTAKVEALVNQVNAIVATRKRAKLPKSPTKRTKQAPMNKRAAAAAPANLPPPPPVPPLCAPQTSSAPPEAWTLLVMYGVQLWPITETRYGSYSYDQIRAAAWSFRDTLSWLTNSPVGNNPAARAIVARLSVRWFNEAAARAPVAPEAQRFFRKIFELIHLIARLYEDNPSAECLIPPTPTSEGEW